MDCPKCNHDVSLHESIPIPATRSSMVGDGMMPYWFACKGCASEVKCSEFNLYACRRVRI